MLLFTGLSPEDICGALFLLPFVRCLHLPASPGSRALPRFLATTEALPPSEHGPSGPPSRHERGSFPALDPPFISIQLLTILRPTTPYLAILPLTALSRDI